VHHLENGLNIQVDLVAALSTTVNEVGETVHACQLHIANLHSREIFSSAKEALRNTARAFASISSATLNGGAGTCSTRTATSS
jgi:hypothetical protein